MIERDESMRQLIEMALNYGKKRKSPQTGYLHFCHHTTDPEPHQTIPVVENFLYALALFRSRLIENIQEAKTLVEALLHFQNTSEGEFAKGNFPIYLHEYPICKDRCTGINAAFAIYAIMKNFHQVAGGDLNRRLEKALALSVEHALDTYVYKKTPYAVSVKIAVIAALSGSLLQLPPMREKGEAMLKILAEDHEDAFLYSPASLGSVALSLSHIYPKISESPFSFLWDYLEKTWHGRTATFAGLCIKEWQDGSEPQVTIYDLLMGYYTGQFSGRAKSEASAHLEAVLLFPSDEPFKTYSQPITMEGSFEGSAWKMYNSGKYAFSYIENGGIPLNPVYEKGFHPYRLIWGNNSRVHTFVCQGGMAKSATFSPDRCVFSLQKEAEAEEREKARELMFYVDIYDGMEFLVSGNKSSTFQLGQTVSIGDKDMSISLNFSLDEGEGRFLGHRMPGNRLAQQAAKGGARYDAYDWQVFLRAVSRDEPCKIVVDLHINEVN